MFLCHIQHLYAILACGWRSSLDNGTSRRVKKAEIQRSESGSCPVLQHNDLFVFCKSNWIHFLEFLSPSHNSEGDGGSSKQNSGNKLWESYLPGKGKYSSAKRAALQVDQLSYIEQSVTVTVSSGSTVPTFVSWNVPSCPPSFVAEVR